MERWLHQSHLELLIVWSRWRAQLAVREKYPMYGFLRVRNWRVFATVAVVVALAGVQYLMLIR